MSGGHWDSSAHEIAGLRDTLLAVAEDETVKERGPMIAEMYLVLSHLLPAQIRAMGWDISGDTRIFQDRTFDNRSLQEVQEGLHQAARRHFLSRNSGGQDGKHCCGEI